MHFLVAFAVLVQLSGLALATPQPKLILERAAIAVPSAVITAAKTSSTCDIFSGVTDTVKFDHPNPAPTTIPSPIPASYAHYGWSGFSFSDTLSSGVNPKSRPYVASTTLPTSASIYMLDPNGIYSISLDSFWFGCAFSNEYQGVVFAQSCGVEVVVLNDPVDGGGGWSSFGPWYFEGYRGTEYGVDPGGYNMTKVTVGAGGQTFYFVVSFAEFGRATLFLDNVVLSRPDPKCT